MTILILLLLLTGCADEGGSPPQAVTPVPQQATAPAPTPQQPASPTPAPPQPAPQTDPQPAPPPPAPPMPEIIPPPPAPEKVALAFTGVFGIDGTVSGTFSYIKAQGPIGTNVRQLNNNVVYQLDDWDITVNGPSSLEDLLPSMRYRKEDHGASVEFCLGYCVFASPPVIGLRFRTDTTLVLQLTFEMQDPTPMINPPSSVSEWGPLIRLASMYSVPCPPCPAVALFRTGTLQEQMKTPETGS